MRTEAVIASRRPIISKSHTDSLSRVLRRAVHERTVIGVAVVALLAPACTTSPIASADYSVDKKKYDDCVAKERDRTAGSPASTYIEAQIRNFCGEPPTAPKGEKK